MLKFYLLALSCYFVSGQQPSTTRVIELPAGSNLISIQEGGFPKKQATEIDLLQNGSISPRRFFASPPTSDDLTKLTLNVPDLNRSALAVAFPARISGAMFGRALIELDNLGLSNRPVATTDWVLRINTESPTIGRVNFAKFNDIVVRFA